MGSIVLELSFHGVRYHVFKKCAHFSLQNPERTSLTRRMPCTLFLALISTITIRHLSSTITLEIFDASPYIVLIATVGIFRRHFAPFA